MYILKSQNYTHIKMYNLGVASVYHYTDVNQNIYDPRMGLSSVNPDCHISKRFVHIIHISWAPPPPPKKK